VTPTAADPAVHRQYDALLFDLDGVLYRGDEPVAGAPETIHRLRADDATIRFLTNNSARTPDEVAERSHDMGIEADPGEVVTSAGATAAPLRREGATGSAYVIGGRGIRSARGRRIEVLDGTPERTDLQCRRVGPRPHVRPARTAALLIQRGARLVATNADATYPAADGLWPGGERSLAAWSPRPAHSHRGRQAVPSDVRGGAEETGAARPLVIGDRLDTDVAGAVTMGWDSLLVLTGASRIEDLAGALWPRRSWRVVSTRS
jgi:ribonucleotide monophosphatase NagD (HAD superfamily)